MWDKITHPFPNFNSAAVEILEWVNNFIPYFTRRDYLSMLGLKLNHVSKRVMHIYMIMSTVFIGSGYGLAPAAQCQVITRTNADLLPIGPISNKLQWNLIQNTISIFIRPFEKRTYYAVAMSVHSSVRLSVRPSVRIFRTFLQHALRYQFETWYIHSVGGTTCEVWVASQLGHFALVYSQK